MIDSAKAIKGLKCCAMLDGEWHCEECPYADHEISADEGYLECSILMCRDALEVIKQQKEKLKRWEKCASFLAMSELLEDAR